MIQYSFHIMHFVMFYTISWWGVFTVSKTTSFCRVFIKEKGYWRYILEGNIKYAPKLVHDSLNSEWEQFYSKFKIEKNLWKSQALQKSTYNFLVETNPYLVNWYETVPAFAARMFFGCANTNIKTVECSTFILYVVIRSPV